MRFFAVTNMMADYTFPIACDRVHPLGEGGWIGFYSGENIQLAISPEYFFFQEIDQQEYENAIELVEQEEGDDEDESVG